MSNKKIKHIESFVKSMLPEIHEQNIEIKNKF